ncbi:MAG: RlmE family RNA methyltransferase [Deltaproteobacteria bacterium]|nr:RlmE family RNA methyltransferase [Deltaproteobacteria bacterium]
MKKVQDYYFKKARKENYPARSVYKLAEAQDRFHFLKRGGNILDIGCYPGSWSIYASKVIGPQGVVIGVDLQAGSRTQQSGRAAIEFIRGDIMDDKIIAAIQEYRPRFNVVLSDMAPQTTGNKWSDQQKSLSLSRRAFVLARELLAQGGSFYCKVFEGEDFKEFYDSVRPCFAKAKIVKPRSSRRESREVFVLGINYTRER